MAVRIAEACSTIEDEGEYVVLDRRTENYYGLNESASFLWRQLAAGVHCPAELAARLEEEHQLPATTAGREVGDFIAKLVDLGLLQEGE